MDKNNEDSRLASIKAKLQFQVDRIEALHVQPHDGSTKAWMTRLIEEVQVKTLRTVLDELEKV